MNDALVTRLHRLSENVIQPLCPATKKLLEPLHLSDNDRLFLEMDDTFTNFVARPFSSDDRLLPSYTAQVALPSRLPECKRLTGGRLQIAGTDVSALILHHAWNTRRTDEGTEIANRLVFYDQHAENMYLYLLTRFLATSVSAKVLRDWSNERIVPDMPDDFYEHPDSDMQMTGAQRVGLLASLEQEYFALFMEQGVGKTYTVIARVCLEASRKSRGLYRKEQREGLYRVLIICPGQVRANWRTEFHRFATEDGKVAVMRGGPLSRTKILRDVVRQESDCKYGVAIMSYDSMPTTLQALNMVPWDLIVLDESHKIKGARAQRTLAAHALRDAGQQRLVLTGTPVANSLNDLWSQLEYLGEGASGFLSRERFRKFYGVYKSTGRGVEKLLRHRNIPLLHERLARMSFVCSQKEAGLDLPDKTYSIHEVSMTKTQSSVYNAVAQRLVAELSTLIEQDDTVSVENILTRLLRLSQITSGHYRTDPVKDEDGRTLAAGELRIIPGLNPKIEALVNEILLDEDRLPEAKMIVWACWVPDIEAISEALTSHDIGHVCYHGQTSEKEREEAVYKYNNDPKCRVFVGNPRCAGEGLNLLGYQPGNSEQSTYTATEVFFSQTWSAIERSQAEARAHRMGTKMPVQIIDLMIPGTIDEEIRARVTAKRLHALAVQDVRGILKAVSDIDTEES